MNIAGGNWGIYAGDPGGGATSNIVIRSVNVDTNAASPGHGVYVGKVVNAVIDRVAVADAQVNGILIDNGSSNAIVTGCTVGTTGGPDSAIKINNSASAYVVGNTVQNTGANAHGILLSTSPNSTVTGNLIVRAHANGILTDNSSDNSVITNNTIQATTTQHGIAVKNSAGVIVAGNTITGSGFHGILLIGAQNSRVIRNAISGVRHDGITLDKESSTGRFSTGNYIASNQVSSTARQAGVAEGTGIWFTSESNGNLAYANSVDGFPENGLSIFNSSYNHLFGNVTWDNSQGGLFIYGPAGLSYAVGPAPSYTVLQGNYAFNLPVNAGINLRQSSSNTAFDNFIQGVPGSTSGGFFLQTTSNNRVFENTLLSLQVGLYAYADTTNSSYFLNRHLTPMQHFVFAPATVVVDGGAVLKGNYWVGHNPNTPYTNFIYSMSGATGGPYQDRYPHSNDTLSKQPSLTILYPTAGTYASIGSQKTIEWRSAGCTYVDIYYQSGITGLVNITINHPDVGLYRWTVPNTAQGSDYTIYIDCKNSINQSLNTSGRSGAFTVAKAGIELLTPQGNERVPAGGQAVVAWKKTTAVTAVDVLYRSDVSDFSTVLVSDITRDTVTVLVPDASTSRGSFLVRASNDHSIADSSDGFVNIRGGAAQVTGPAHTLQIGTLQQVEWISPVNSQYIDISYVNTSSGNYVPIVQNLPDFGRFTFLVPEQTMTASKLRVEFKSTPAVVINAIDSGAFNTSVTGGEPPSPGLPPSESPSVLSFSPRSGVAITGAFTAGYSHPSGKAGHYLAYILFLPTPNVVNYVATGSCLVEYNRISNGMRLINDAGTGWLGGESGVPVGAAGTTLSNSYCTLDTTQSGARFSGNNMYVDARVTFKAPLNGVLGTFLQELDVNGVWTGMTQFGNWLAFPVASPKPGPYVAGGSSAGDVGSSTIYNITVGHTGSIAALSVLHLLISSQIVGGAPCQIVFFPAANTLHLINDTGSALVAGSITAGSNTGTLANSRCTVSGAGLTRTNSGQNVTLRIPVSINPATFQGAKNIYVNAFDKDGLLTHWQQLDASVPGGAVAADPVPRTVSLSWSASVSPNVKGYYVYRAEISGGPYAQLTAWPVYATSYADDTVAFGETYYYVTTAVDINDIESAYSNEAAAVVPPAYTPTEPPYNPSTRSRAAFVPLIYDSPRFSRGERTFNGTTQIR